jgi:hypothetical protein
MINATIVPSYGVALVSFRLRQGVSCRNVVHSLGRLVLGTPPLALRHGAITYT